MFNVINAGHQEISPKPGALRLFGQKMVKLAHTGFGYSKGMVYAKINTPNRPILFVNMHLPMDGKNLATLGLKYRQASFLNLLVKLKSSGLLEDKPLIFVAGDLNFRMDPSGKNQLNTILKSNDQEVTKLLYGLKELASPSGEPRGITCKFSEEHNPECLSRKIPENPNNIPKFLETIQADCGVPLRTPSRCDRFLVSKDVAPLTILLNTSKYIFESDHNAIMCCFEFLERPSKKGGRTYKLKKNKNKRTIKDARLRNKSKVASR
jgi:endonuclease/exonuclease/phosphatase family metal-dependent hydrolase